MRYLLILSLLIQFLQAQQCDTLYQQSKEKASQVQALITSKIASHKAYEIINNYLNLASSTIAACANSESRNAFRITRELNADMKRVSIVRENFRVQTFNELKAAAMIQAKKEVKCTNVYNNNYNYIKRKNEASIQPVR